MIQEFELISAMPKELISLGYIDGEWEEDIVRNIQYVLSGTEEVTREEMVYNGQTNATLKIRIKQHEDDYKKYKKTGKMTCKSSLIFENCIPNSIKAFEKEIHYFAKDNQSGKFTIENQRIEDEENCVNKRNKNKNNKNDKKSEAKKDENLISFMNNTNKILKIDPDSMAEQIIQKENAQSMELACYFKDTMSSIEKIYKIEGIKSYRGDKNDITKIASRQHNIIKKIYKVWYNRDINPSTRRRNDCPIYYILTC